MIAPMRVLALVVGGTLALGGCGDSGKGSSSTIAKLPQPAFAETVDLRAVSGKVLVEPPASGGFSTLSGDRQLPVGTVVDAHAGVVRLTAATGSGGRLASGEFQAGVFEIRQSRAEPGVTELRIRDDPAARAACARRPSRRVFGRLLGDANGRFRTRGRTSAATVRGTAWGVRDRCDGTLTIVRRGTVVVDDFARHERVVVRAGDSYLAKSP
jgi:hypothetical protein